MQYSKTGVFSYRKEQIYSSLVCSSIEIESYKQLQDNFNDAFWKRRNDVFKAICTLLICPICEVWNQTNKTHFVGKSRKSEHKNVSDPSWKISLHSAV
jgi:hypothetical protein